MRTDAYVTAATLDRRCAAWLREVRAAVAPRPRLRLDPQRCCLLVVDMLRYFAAPEGRCYLPASAAIVPRIASLLDAWRGLGRPVIFTRHGHQGPDDLGMLGRFFDDYIRAGEPEGEIVATLAPRAQEAVLRKTTYDAFRGTQLAALLEGARATQVLVTGVLTHMCCETTARSAFCRGFEVYVAADGTASHSEERHVHALIAMADSVAVVLDTEEILARCRPAT
jgi:nicotinamidase-related amidase